MIPWSSMGKYPKPTSRVSRLSHNLSPYPPLHAPPATTDTAHGAKKPESESLRAGCGTSGPEVRQGFRLRATGISEKDLNPETCSLKPPPEACLILFENHCR